MIPVFPTMWQRYPATNRDLMDYLTIWLLEDLTDEELQRGIDYLDSPWPESCMVHRCGRPVHARDLCTTHYARWRRANPGSTRSMTSRDGECSGANCHDKIHAGGMCRHHYYYYRRDNYLE